MQTGLEESENGCHGQFLWKEQCPGAAWAIWSMTWKYLKEFTT